MDRRQRKTREAIFSAFITLLAKKSFDRITVGEIIALADVGRATFYAHFETKDDLLRALCEELFDHVFESASGGENAHSHIFDCHAPTLFFCICSCTCKRMIITSGSFCPAPTTSCFCAISRMACAS